MQPRMRHNRKWKILTCVSVSIDRMLHIACVLFLHFSTTDIYASVSFYSSNTYCTYFLTLYQIQIKLFVMCVFFGVNRIKPLRNRIQRIVSSEWLRHWSCAYLNRYVCDTLILYTYIFYVHTIQLSEWVRDTCSGMFSLWIIIYWNFCRSLTSSACWFISDLNECIHFVSSSTMFYWISFKINVVCCIITCRLKIWKIKWLTICNTLRSTNIAWKMGFRERAFLAEKKVLITFRW